MKCLPPFSGHVGFGRKADLVQMGSKVRCQRSFQIATVNLAIWPSALIDHWPLTVRNRPDGSGTGEKPAFEVNSEFNYVYQCASADQRRTLENIRKDRFGVRSITLHR
jgi:hypothetical protein